MIASRMNKRRGFTLTEMMTALGLGVIIMLVVTSVFSQAMGLFTVSRGKIRAVNNARVAMQFIEADIQGAFGYTDRLFIGTSDGQISNLGVDNDGDGSVDEDQYDNTSGDDPYDFTNDDNKYNGLFPAGSDSGTHFRSGLEMLSMSRFSFDSAGHSTPYTHVLYYVTQDRQEGDYTVGRLIRYMWNDAGDSSLTSVFDPADYRAQLTEDDSITDPPITSTTVGLAVVNFRVRFFDGSTWSDSWFNFPTGPQQGTLPEVIQVELSVIDSKGILAREGNRPYTLSRLIEVSAY